MMQLRRALFAFAVLMSVVGCGGPPKEPKGFREKIGDIVPLTGKVTLDGAAPTGVYVAALNEKMLDQYKQQGELGGLAAQAGIKADGTFQFTTLSGGDGLPAGNYIVLFGQVVEKRVPNPKAESFNKKYLDPLKSEFKATLEKGKPVDLGPIALTTK